MNRKLLATAIVAVLASPHAFAQDASQDPDSAAQATTATPSDPTTAKALDKIYVTGSLIPQSQIETASPVLKITAEEIQKAGFRNVYDAIRAVPLSTGSVQDSQNTNTFTPGANTVSLLGLDPSFTLVLMNGRPLADYPLLYNSSSNFQDLATIPTFLVERIDILPGNQSAVYGSAAIAGVINIITKKDMNGDRLSARFGSYTDGGGASRDFTWAGGHDIGGLNISYGAEFKHQEPIFGYQRDFTDSTLDAPNGIIDGSPPFADNGYYQRASLMRGERDAFTGLYVDPGSLCDDISFLNDGTMQRVIRPPAPGRTTSGGIYCGSTQNVGNTTFMNERDDYNGYLALNQRVGENAELYGDILYNVNKVKYRTGGVTFWGLGDGTAPYIYDLDSGHLVDVLQHIFAPEEVGSLADANGTQHAYVFDAGVRGTLGQSNWDYDVYYHRSYFQSEFSQRRTLTDPVNAFFLGPQDGTDPYGYGYPAYHIQQNGNFWGAVTGAEYESISDVLVERAKTYSQQVAGTLTNTQLFDLFGRHVGFAGIVEVGDQYWDNPIDPRVTAGDFWGQGGTSGHGRRQRQAVGAELNMPLGSMFTVDTSARWDRYNAAGSSQAKWTYKLGLEFRPTDTLLIRGNYATAFRAPDMGYVFTGGSKYFTSGQDTYNCRRFQDPTAKACDSPYDLVGISGGAIANPDLKYITAKSWGLGFVWSPVDRLTLKGDYYNIKISNEVSNYDTQTILDKEADCRLGVTVDGTPVDPNSAECQQILSQVTRDPDSPVGPGQLQDVQTVPINIADESVSGFITNVTYTLPTASAGTFTFSWDHNRTLKHDFQQFPDSEVRDYTSPNWSNEYLNIDNLSTSWDIGNWSATVHGTRYGSSGSAGLDSTGNYYRFGPWTVFNASLQYNPTPALEVTLSANNIFNRRPPRDPGYTSYPYYNIYNYNGFGRLVMLEVAYKFGAMAGK